MEVKSEAKYIRISPRKLRLLAEMVKDLTPKEALTSLSLTNKRGARLLFAAIKNALANAVSNFKLKEEDLKFKKIEINQGPVFKRWRPVARGVAHQLKKRLSHIKILLEEKH